GRGRGGFSSLSNGTPRVAPREPKESYQAPAPRVQTGGEYRWIRVCPGDREELPVRAGWDCRAADPATPPGSALAARGASNPWPQAWRSPPPGSTGLGHPFEPAQHIARGSFLVEADDLATIGRNHQQRGQGGDAHLFGEGGVGRIAPRQVDLHRNKPGLDELL